MDHPNVGRSILRSKSLLPKARVGAVVSRPAPGSIGAPLGEPPV